MAFIIMQLHKQHAMLGETITGKICLVRATPASAKLQLIGKECIGNDDIQTEIHVTCHPNEWVCAKNEYIWHFSITVPANLPGSFCSTDQSGLQLAYSLKAVVSTTSNQTAQAVQLIAIQQPFLPLSSWRMFWGSRPSAGWRYELEVPHTIALDDDDNAMGLAVRARSSFAQDSGETCLVRAQLFESVKIRGHAPREYPLLRLAHLLTSPSYAWRSPSNLSRKFSRSPHPTLSSVRIKISHRLMVSLTFFDAHGQQQDLVEREFLIMVTMTWPTSTVENYTPIANNNPASSICLSNSPLLYTLSSC